MNAPYRIEVTSGHIRRGEQQNSCACPIALAIKEQWPGLVTEIEVLMEAVNVDVPGGVYHAEMPRNAGNFVEAFDFGTEVAPFSFELDWRFAADPDVT